MNPKKWTRPEKILWLMPGLLLAFVGVLLLAPTFSRSFEAMLENLGIPTTQAPRRARCQSNEKQMGLAVMQYVRDYDEKFPLVASSGPSFGWASALIPYHKAPSLYQCPTNAGAAAAKPTSRGYTDYFHNARLARQSLGMLDVPSQTVLFGEGPPSDARSAQTNLPNSWISNRNSPARLHFASGSATRSGANYAFADGHVKWIEPQFIGSAPTTKGGWTFSLR